MRSNSFDLTGKTALITGSSKGLGLVLAKGLAEAGATIVLNGRDSDKLEAAKQELQVAGHKVYSCQFDVTDESGVNEAIEALVTRIGLVDILVNNAGVQFRAPLEDFPVQEWRRILDINLTGAFIVAKCLVKYMIQNGGGKIINICSLQSELGRNTIAPYAASKGGLQMLTRGMAVDWAKYNIQTNAIGPGYFITVMTKPLADDPVFDSWLKKRTPAGRWGNPEELIGSLLLFASEASSYINGQTLFVDGGLISSV